MMQAVKGSLEDADIALLMLDMNEDFEESNRLFTAMHLKVPAIVVLNKADKANEEQHQKATEFFRKQPYCKKLVVLSALKNKGIDYLLEKIVSMLPEGAPFYEGDDLSDLPTKTTYLHRLQSEQTHSGNYMKLDPAEVEKIVHSYG